MVGQTKEAAWVARHRTASCLSSSTSHPYRSQWMRKERLSPKCSRHRASRVTLNRTPYSFLDAQAINDSTRTDLQCGTQWMLFLLRTKIHLNQVKANHGWINRGCPINGAIKDWMEGRMSRYFTRKNYCLSRIHARDQERERESVLRISGR